MGGDREDAPCGSLIAPSASLCSSRWLAAAAPARAGGPLIVDPTSGKPWRYAPGTVVPVFHDIGDYAVVIDWENYPATVTFDNAVGAGQVRAGFASWSSVPSTSFRAQVKGDFASLGLPDITGANADLIIGRFNGGGVHVIFDADGSVFENFFGVGPNVLGISTPEFGDAATGYITESWTVLNGQAITASDVNAAHYQGVATHEFGHSIGLAHTQTNGAAYFYGPYIGEPVGPQSCSVLPYRTDLTARGRGDDVPVLRPLAVERRRPGQANVHTSDDRRPSRTSTPGAAGRTPTAPSPGQILDVDGKTPLTGVNVIVRNLDDPFVDAELDHVGEWTQGQFGPDGTFTLHGLRPGARYVVYVDAVMAGGFPTPPMWFLPGAERFYNGPLARRQATTRSTRLRPLRVQRAHPRGRPRDEGGHRLRARARRAGDRPAGLRRRRDWGLRRRHDRGRELRDATARPSGGRRRRESSRWSDASPPAT